MLVDFFFPSFRSSARRIQSQITGDGNEQDYLSEASKGNEAAGEAASEGRATRKEKISQERRKRGTDGDHIGSRQPRPSVKLGKNVVNTNDTRARDSTCVSAHVCTGSNSPS